VYTPYHIPVKPVVLVLRLRLGVAASFNLASNLLHLLGNWVMPT